MSKADKMNLEEAIRQLKDIKQDKESFIENDREHNEIFEEDIKAIDIILNYINNSISKEVIEKKIEELDKLIIETQKELGSASKEYTIYVYQKQVLQELLEGK